MRRRAPAFWERGGGRLAPALLAPFAALASAATARRVKRGGFRAPVPVICCGNVTVGGAGKTTVALDLGRRLIARGLAPHFLLRGYGGSARGVRRVRAGDDAALVGDEALLLAEVAPTWTGADRAAGARAAVAAGAQILVMDDGLQNPTLVKDLSLLVVDGGFGFGNGRVMPAGPLREAVAAGAARCRAAVLIGEDVSGALSMLPSGLPVLRAALVPVPEAASLAGRSILAFAGIGRPEKFFATLSGIGAVLAATLPFPDHHPYTEREIGGILDRAARLGAVAVTTPKDAVRIPAALRGRVQVAGVTLAWQDADGIEHLLDLNSSLRRSARVHHGSANPGRSA